MEVPDIIPSELIKEVRISRERVEIHMRNGQIIVLQPTYSREIVYCRKGDDDCYRENVFLEMVME